MASESDTPKVMKHMSKSAPAPDLDNTNALASLSTTVPDEDEETPVSPDEAMEPEAVSVADPDADEAPGEEADDASGDAATPDDMTDGAEETEAAGTDDEGAHDSVAESAEGDVPEQAMADEEQDGAEALAESSEPEDSTPDEADAPEAEDEPRRVSNHASHAAPMRHLKPAEPEEAAEPVEPEETAEPVEPEAAAEPREAAESAEPKRPEEPARSKRARRAKVSTDDAAYAKAAGTAEPPVYGLEVNEEERAMRQKREASQRAVRIGLAVAAIAGACWFFGARPISRLLNQSTGTRTEPVVARQDFDKDALTDGDQDADVDSEETTDQEGAQEATEADAEKQDSTAKDASKKEAPYELAAELTTDNLAEHAKEHLSFDGNDVSPSDTEVTAAVSTGGRVQIDNLVTATTGLEATAVAGNAALRAAAMANDLTGHQVIAANNTKVAPTDVVWVVRNGTGDSYLVVTYPVGNAPTTGEGLKVLAASPRYRLSDSLYIALGRTIQQEMGETPMGADGKYIWSTGVLPSS